MLIVLEGPDGAGKTTLAETLAANFGLAISHEGPPPAVASLSQHYLDKLASVDGADGQVFGGTILDRFALGERVYGPVLRGFDRLGADGWNRVAIELAWRGAVQILCLPNVESCIETWRARRGAELLEREEQIRKVWDAYFKLRNGQIIYDYEAPNAYFEIEAAIVRGGNRR